jgi:hypothetical protein
MSTEQRGQVPHLGGERPKLWGVRRSPIGCNCRIQDDWPQLPRKLRGSTHSYKYRLALVKRGICVVRYDNEAGKGDHRHIGQKQEPYRFTDLDTLIRDFRESVKEHLT